MISERLRIYSKGSEMKLGGGGSACWGVEEEGLSGGGGRGEV